MYESLHVHNWIACVFSTSGFLASTQRKPRCVCFATALSVILSIYERMVSLATPVYSVKREEGKDRTPSLRFEIDNRERCLILTSPAAKAISEPINRSIPGAISRS